MMQPPTPLEGLAYYTQSLLALWPEKAVIGSCCHNGANRDHYTNK